MKSLNTRFNTNNTIYNLRSIFYTLEMNNKYLKTLNTKFYTNNIIYNLRSVFIYYFKPSK